MRRARLAGIAGLFAIATIGCRFTVGHLALLSTRAGGSPADRSLGRGHGKSCVRIVTVFPVGRLPRLGDAIDEATGRDGHMLRNAVVRHRISYVPFVFGVACYEVEGEVW